MHQEMARIEDQLRIHDSPSAPVVPDEAVNAGRETKLPIPAHARGVSSKSAWKGEQDDPKGVIGVCLENENDMEPTPEHNPVEEVKKEMMREELNSSPLVYEEERDRDLHPKHRSLSTHSPRKINRTR